MHRKCFGTVIIMITILLLSACGGSSGSTSSSTTNLGPGELDSNKQYNVSFWEAFATGANKTTLEELTQQYMKAHPNVKVSLQAYDSYPTLKTKLTAAIAAGKPPTLSQVYEEWATQYQQAGSITSLEPFMKGKNGLSQNDLSDFYPTMLKDGQINGTQYMLPFNKSVIVLYYNADALQKLGLTPPKTVDDLTNDLTKATKADGSQWGLSYTPDVDGWSILYKAFGGGNIISTDGKNAEFGNSTNAPFATKALSTLAPLVKSGAVHVTKGYTWQNDFVSQKSVFALSTIASYAFINNLIKDSFKFNEAPVPAGPAGQFTTLFGTNLAMYSKADADSQSAAWDYMKFLTSTDADATFVQKTGYMPVRQSAFDSAALQSYYSKNPARKVGPQSINYGFVASTYPAWDQCRDIITNNFTSVLTGQSTGDAALSKMTQSCNSVLSQG
jgi:multiple sugar transport system substrate-binding protein